MRTLLFIVLAATLDVAAMEESDDGTVFYLWREGHRSRISTQKFVGYKR